MCKRRSYLLTDTYIFGYVRPNYAAASGDDPALLSWVIEGIQECIGEPQDDLHYVVHLQSEKLAARPPLG